MEQSGRETTWKNNLPAASFAIASCVKLLSCAYLKPTTRSISVQTETRTLRRYLLPYVELRLDTPPRELARPVMDDPDNVEEGTVRAAHPTDEASIATQTFYNRSHQNSIQGTEYKKIATKTGNETIKTTAFMEGVVIEPVYNRISVPEVIIYYPVDGLLCKDCYTLFPTVSLFKTHLIEVHRVKNIRTKCSHCDKAGEYHAIAYHYPKCKGKKQSPTGDFACSTCDQRFSTQSSLGQHERHRRSILRNEKLLKPAPKVKGKPGRSDRVWSQEEVTLLRELHVRFAGCKFINKSIASILKSKTPKQI
ncbi:hypothetical protein chiPu_0015107 [Chiloscyllium punctatum]|uniref:C2H2-type domain-containing protein n=1 Tax=Chiloscyllium punctatum TaxID=137246 RepID=A0A401T1S3_CHIPU|nr:hypothetical protein [Chiloscyllium punctatum]